MRGLVRSELRRLGARRFVRVLGVLVLLGIIVGGALQFATSSRDVDAARREASSQVRSCIERFGGEGSLVPEGLAGVESPEAFCEQQFEALLEVNDPRFRFADEVPSILRGVGLAFIVLAFLLGASLAGAEWGSGYVTPLLTWEPRRGVLLGAKLAAVGPAIGLAAFLGLALVAATQYPAAAFRGTTVGADGSFWWSLVGLWGKGSALAALWAVAGVSLATITRNTAAAIGMGLAYGTIVDPLLGAWKDWLAPWLLQRNLFHMLGLPVTGTRTVEADFGGTQTMFVEVEAPSLALTLGRLSAYIAAVVIVAYATFRARDVT